MTDSPFWKGLAWGIVPGRVAESAQANGADFARFRPKIPPQFPPPGGLHPPPVMRTGKAIDHASDYLGAVQQ